jgi:hypothetical protein
MSRSFRSPLDPVPQRPPVFLPRGEQPSPRRRGFLAASVAAISGLALPAAAETVCMLRHAPANMTAPPGIPYGPVPTPVPAEVLTHPDAELIRLCAEHPRLIAAYDGDDDEDGSAWAAYERSRNAIAAARPQTVFGMVAKARAAKAEARCLDGIERPNNCPAADWAWDLVNDLLRLTGGDA